MEQFSLGNSTLAIERLTSDCLPDQFIRELVLNSIQAIERSGIGDSVVVTIDPYYTKKLGARKMAIIDNSVGMDVEGLYSSIQLFCNESGQDTNYGVGGKLSTLARGHRQPFGVEYRTWKGAKCTVARLTYPKGFELIENPPEANQPGFKPELIKKNGTVVVILGHNDKDDTMLRPEGSTAREGVYWVCQYLNSKFSKVPEGIKVKALQLPSNSAPNGSLRPVRGFLHYMSLCPLKQGVVDLTDFSLRWFVLPPDTNNGEAGQIHNFTNYKGGQVCILHKGEFYNVESGMSALRRFGIYAGSSQVAIILEPHNPEKFGANTSRSALERRVGGSKRPISLEDIGSEFKNRIPKGLQDFVNSAAGKNRKLSGAVFDARLYEVHGITFRIDGKGKDKVPSEPGGVNGVPKGTVGGGEDGGRPSGSREKSPTPITDGFVPSSDPTAKKRGASKTKGLPPILLISLEASSWPNDKTFCTYFENGHGKEIQTNPTWYGIRQFEQVIAKTTEFDEGEMTRQVIEKHLGRHMQDIVYSALESLQQGFITKDEFKALVSDSALTSAASARVNLLPGIKQSLTHMRLKGYFEDEEAAA